MKMRISTFGRAAVTMLLCFAVAMVIAQPAAPAPTPVPVNLQNVYAGGVAYSIGATPAVAGTALYAHLLTDTGTYAFTAVDALPNTAKPFTVSTNFGVGVGQKVMTMSKAKIFMPTAAGISFNGTNTGWQWNGGIIASIPVKGNYFLMPSVRFLRSSVSNGAGYQPILGILVGWGQ